MVVQYTKWLFVAQVLGFYVLDGQQQPAEQKPPQQIIYLPVAIPQMPMNQAEQMNAQDARDNAELMASAITMAANIGKIFLDRENPHNLLEGLWGIGQGLYQGINTIMRRIGNNSSHEEQLLKKMFVLLKIIETMKMKIEG